MLYVLFCCMALPTAAQQIVYIDGVKYTIHTVEKGETMYSLSRHYGVTLEQLTRHNPILKAGLKTGQRLKIPYTGKTEKDGKFPKKLFETHTVTRGETLYSIARKYGVSLDMLVVDNGNLDPTHLSVGQMLRIRKSGIGQTDAAEVHQELQQRSEAMSSVANGDFGYHVVHKGEDSEKIAKKTGTTPMELLAMNGFEDEGQIQEGVIIKVPKSADGESVPAEQNRDSTELEEPVAVSFKRLSPTQRAKVALMLPLSNNGIPAVNYADFYQGFMLGLDDIRKEGYSVNLRLYNTAHDHLRINSLLDSGELENTDLIIGPVYEDELMQVVKFAERKAVPVVSPLAAVDSLSSSVLFQMSPDMDAKFDKVGELFYGSRRIVMINTDSVDREFETEVMQLIGSVPYETHLYQYEHPSVLAERKEDDPPSPGDLSPLLQSDDPRETLFLVMADNETDVDRILAALASANISLTARAQKVVPFAVFGNTRWNRYRNIDRAIFFADNVIMLSSYHARRDSERVKAFDSRYAEVYGTIPSLYSYRGYDAAAIFVKSLYGDIETSLDGKTSTPLQTPYRFIRKGDSATLVNGEWVRVNYRRNFSIVTQ